MPDPTPDLRYVLWRIRLLATDPDLDHRNRLLHIEQEASTALGDSHPRDSPPAHTEERVMPQTTEPAYVTVPALARRLRITPQRVGQYIRAGRLRASRIGRDYLITEPEADRFCAARALGRPLDDA